METAQCTENKCDMFNTGFDELWNTVWDFYFSHTPREHPWWRKWGCCCQSGPSCPLQCKTWPQSLVDLARCRLTPIHQLKENTFVSLICSKYTIFLALCVYCVYVLLTHSGEADSDGCCLPNMLKHFGLTIVSDVMSHLKVAKRSWIM